MSKSSGILPGAPGRLDRFCGLAGQSRRLIDEAC